MKTRYVAEWTVDDGDQDEYSFDPAICNYGYAARDRLWKAERLARRQADKGTQPDWWRVTEQQYDPNYYERGVGDWDDASEWICGEQVHSW